MTEQRGVRARLQPVTGERKRHTIFTMNITTNHIYRDVLRYQDLNISVRKEIEGSYEGVEESQFFIYKNTVYDLSDFMVPESTTIFGGWDGYCTDSFFSAIVIKFKYKLHCEHDLKVKVGLALT